MRKLGMRLNDLKSLRMNGNETVQERRCVRLERVQRRVGQQMDRRIKKEGVKVRKWVKSRR